MVTSGKRLYPRGLSKWTRVQLMRETRMRRRLQQRHWLRLHALLTGGLSLGCMLALSWGLLHAGVHSMGLRYGLALGSGYVIYLLLVRLWAGCMLRQDWGDAPLDFPSSSHNKVLSADAGMESGQGGAFSGGGASGQWSEAGGVPLELPALSDTASVSSSALDVPGLDALDGDGVVLVPVLLLFAGLLLLATGAGSLLWLVMGSELFLAVAMEVAFALLMARTLYVVEREGWLLAALRLSYKPMLSALVLAVVFGAVADWLFPHADTLAQVIKALSGG